MKIAIVNQATDMILPPYQTSVGACTYGAARCLAKFSEVLVYGLQDSHNGVSADLVDRGVRFHFIPSSPRERVLYKIRHKLRLGLLTAPESSSAWSFPEFGRQVAADLQKQRCDLIHVQHSSQHVPVIRAFNPDAKIVLHLHNFVVFDRPTLARRLRNVDLVTPVSDYVTQKPAGISQWLPIAWRPLTTASMERELGLALADAGSYLSRLKSQLPHRNRQRWRDRGVGLKERCAGIGASAS